MCASKPLIRSREKHFLESPLASQMMCFWFSEIPCLKGVRQRATREDTCSGLGRHTMVFTYSVPVSDCRAQIHMQTHHKQEEVYSGFLLPWITLQGSPYSTFEKYPYVFDHSLSQKDPLKPHLWDCINATNALVCDLDKSELYCSLRKKKSILVVF